MASRLFGEWTFFLGAVLHRYISLSSYSPPSHHCLMFRNTVLENPTNRHRLVATLGAKSNTKKVTRKAILDVDVRKACETIVQPEAPMALRLQSNLL